MIDEDGLGYTDVGEEIDWGTAEEEPEAGGSDGKGKAKKGAPPPPAPCRSAPRAPPAVQQAGKSKAAYLVLEEPKVEEWW